MLRASRKQLSNHSTQTQNDGSWFRALALDWAPLLVTSLLDNGSNWVPRALVDGVPPPAIALFGDGFDFIGEASYIKNDVSDEHFLTATSQTLQNNMKSVAEATKNNGNVSASASRRKCAVARVAFKISDFAVTKIWTFLSSLCVYHKLEPITSPMNEKTTQELPRNV